MARTKNPSAATVKAWKTRKRNAAAAKASSTVTARAFGMDGGSRIDLLGYTATMDATAPPKVDFGEKGNSIIRSMTHGSERGQMARKTEARIREDVEDRVEQLKYVYQRRRAETPIPRTSPRWRSGAQGPENFSEAKLAKRQEMTREEGAEAIEDSKLLTEILDKAPAYKGEASRGMALTGDQLKKLRVGSTVEFPVVSSWSRDPNVAAAYAETADNEGWAHVKHGMDGYIEYTPDRLQTETTPVVMRVRSKRSLVSIEGHAAYDRYGDDPKKRPDLALREAVNRRGVKYKIRSRRKVKLKYSYKRWGQANEGLDVVLLDLEEA